MGKYFNVSPATGTGGGVEQTVDVTPVSGFTGRGPVSETIRIESQNDPSVYVDRTATRRGVNTTQSAFQSSLKAYKAISSATTPPTTGWEAAVTANWELANRSIALTTVAQWLKVTFNLNCQACLLTIQDAVSKGKNMWVEIDGKWLKSDGSLSSTPVAYNLPEDPKLPAVLISGDPGLEKTYTVNLYQKFNDIGSANVGLWFWGIKFGPTGATPEGSIKYIINEAIGIAQTNEASISVTPASLDFGTTAEKKTLSVISLDPWKASVR